MEKGEYLYIKISPKRSKRNLMQYIHNNETSYKVWMARKDMRVKLV